MSAPPGNAREVAAGPETDALIAEKVMGWTPFEALSGTAQAHTLYVEPGRLPRLWNAAHPRPYSTDIAAAWLVIEKLRESGWVIGVGIDDEPWEDPAGDGTHGCSLLGCNRGRIDNTEIREYADTTPLAICRAALKSVLA